jgi:hypothetical protein
MTVDLSQYLTLSYLLSLANIMGFIGALCYVATVVMKTMVPLRTAAIASNFFLGMYGLLAHSLPTFLLYTLLLPINVVRLYQMLQLVKQVKAATQGDMSMEWLKPFMTKRNYYKGDVLFRKGDAANEMFFIVTGSYRVSEINVDLAPGALLGEMGLLAPDNRRTQSVECTESGQVLTINYDKVRELYFQNPEFGFYFLRLTSERLLQNVARLERVIEQNRLKVATEAAKGAI